MEPDLSAFQDVDLEPVRLQVTELEARRDRLERDLEEAVESRAAGSIERCRNLRTALERNDGDLDKAKSKLRLLEGVASGRVGMDAGWDSGVRNGPTTVGFRGDPYRSPSKPESAVEIRSRAIAGIEKWNADSDLRESATRMVERLDSDDARGVAAHVLRYSAPDYISAFRKFSRDPESYVADLTPEERRAWSEAREYQRSTLGLAGAVLPAPLDPTVVLTNDADIDPMRSVARIDSTTSLSKRYVTSAGSTFSFDAELAEVSDDTPSLTEVEVDTEKAQGWVEASIEVAMDQPGFDVEVARIIADGKARLEAAKFVTGSGSDEPLGIVTALTGTASEEDAAGEGIVADDVYELLEALPPRFRQQAAWQLELSTLNALARLYNPTGDEPPLIEGGQLLRRPYFENSNVDPASAIDPTATATHRPLIVASWRNYVVLDRVGLAVHYVGPGILRGASDRPDGRVGWYSYWRVGAKPLTTAAFRMLKVATTA